MTSVPAELERKINGWAGCRNQAAQMDQNVKEQLSGAENSGPCMSSVDVIIRSK